MRKTCADRPPVRPTLCPRHTPLPESSRDAHPPRRVLRAGSRFSASSMLMSVAVAIIPFPSFSKIVVVVIDGGWQNLPRASESRTTIDQRLFLNKKPAHRCLFVNRLDRPSNQPAIESTLIFETCRAASLSGMCSDHHLGNRGVQKIFHAAPESTGCEQHA